MTLVTESLWLLCGEKKPREGRKGGGRPVGTGFLALTAQCDSLRGKTKHCSRTGAEFPGPGDSKVEEDKIGSHWGEGGNLRPMGEQGPWAPIEGTK